jgi:hypothetical protein
MLETLGIVLLCIIYPEHIFRREDKHRKLFNSQKQLARLVQA